MPTDTYVRRLHTTHNPVCSQLKKLLQINTMAARNWFFTLNNPTPEEDPRKWKQTRWVKWQLEKGEEGTMHWQGVVEMECVKRMTGMKKINARAHWEVTRDVQKSIGYVTKSNTRIDGPWEHGEAKQQGQRSDLEAACETAMTKGMSAVMQEHPTACAKYHKNLSIMAKDARAKRMALKEKEEMEVCSLRPWQQDLWDKLSKAPDPRKIMWYWESNGNVGKTWFAKYMMAMKGATVLDCSKKADLIYMLRDHEGEVVLFNVVRSMEQEFMGHIYTVCESIKDDVVINTKYESCRIPMGKQHVVVFANEPPNMEKWSKDRYDVVPIESPWTSPPQPTSNKRKREIEPAADRYAKTNEGKRMARESYTMDAMYE